MSTAPVRPLPDLLNPLLGPHWKGYPHTAEPMPRAAIGQQGWQVLGGDLPLPIAVVKRPQLQHNLGWMQRFCEGRGIALAPHGKTSLSPQLFALQLQAGAWGLTVATVAQVHAAVAGGAQRVLIANQVLQGQDLAGLAALLQQHAGLRVMFLLDSTEQLAMVEAASAALATQINAAPRFEVLLELGLVGGRTGCRSHDQALALARAARASTAVHLAGIECYEGGLSTGDSAHDVPATQALMDRVAAVARQCAAEGLFSTRVPGDALVVSAGGSALFDLVAPGLATALPSTPEQPVQGLLRSGCYVTHDQGHYKRLVGVINQRIGCAEAQGLQAALEVWAVVQSVPEPGLALLTAGRRDVSFDISLPQPVAWCPQGSTVPQAVPAGWQVTALNDQHAYLRMGAGSGGVDATGGATAGATAEADGAPPVLRVGDRVGLGISHPCTTFDKWRWLPVVDADYQVVDALVTWF